MNELYKENYFQGNYSKIGVIPTMQKSENSKTIIRSNMSPTEIAEAFSEQMMQVIRKQFDSVSNVKLAKTKKN